MDRAAFEAWIRVDSTLPTDRDQHGYTDMTTALMWHAWQAAGRQALKDAAPLLVRDVAAMLGAEVPAVCIALTTLGFPPRSTNMEVTPAEAVAVARLKALRDAAQAVGPEDSYQDEWFRAKADAVQRILALPGA